MRNVDLEPFSQVYRLLRFLARTWTFPQDFVMALLVDGALAHLTLVPLFSKAPEEVPAEGAEGRLPEELGHELVSLDAVDLLVAYGTAAPGDARHRLEGFLVDDGGVPISLLLNLYFQRSRRPIEARTELELWLLVRETGAVVRWASVGGALGLTPPFASEHHLDGRPVRRSLPSTPTVRRRWAGV